MSHVQSALLIAGLRPGLVISFAVAATDATVRLLLKPSVNDNAPRRGALRLVRFERAMKPAV